MNIKPLKTKTDYKAALKEVESLMRAKPGTPAGDRLDVLVTLVQAYEAKHYPLDFPDPVEAIKFTMEQKGLTVKDLEPTIGRYKGGLILLLTYWQRKWKRGCAAWKTKES